MLLLLCIMLRIIRFTIICLLFFSTSMLAQQGPFALQSLSLSVVNENVAFPAIKIFGNPLHPGMAAGASFTFNRSEKSWFELNPEIGFYLHRQHENGLLVTGPVNYHYRFNFGMAVGGGIGIGYLHTFSNQPEYRMQDGVYKRFTGAGNPQFLVTTGLNVSYRFFAEASHPMDIFAAYKFLVQLPYAAPIGIPLLPHTIFQFGTSWYLFP